MGASLSSEPMAEATRRVERGEGVVLATVIRTDGQPPCRPGQKLLVSAEGPLAGTLGCPGFDARAVSEAPALLASGEPVVSTFEHHRGTFDVYLEPMRPKPQLLVLGGTPLAAHLLRGGRDLGYTTVLLEGRPDRVTELLRSEAGRVVETLDEVDLGPTTDAVSTDHDAPTVTDDLARLLRAGIRFVGALGSRRRVEIQKQLLHDVGCTEAEIAELRSPVGLDVGARTPAEISVSILAGILAARAGRTGQSLDEQQPVAAPA